MSLTGKLGQYQNEITALSAVDLGRYENIFKVYTEPTNGKQFYFYNILNKIEFPKNLDSDYFRQPHKSWDKLLKEAFSRLTPVWSGNWNTKGDDDNAGAV